MTWLTTLAILFTFSVGDKIEISADKAYLREGPSKQQKIIQILEKGKTAKISELSDEWLQISIDNTTLGWVLAAQTTIIQSSAQELQTIIPTRPPIESIPILARVSQDAKMLHSIPEATSGIIIQQNTLVQIIGKNKNYIKIITANGEIGWMDSIDLTEALDAQSEWDELIKPHKIAIVTGGKTVLRDQAGNKGVIKSKANVGDSLSVTSVQDDYIEVLTHDNQNQWVKAKDVQIIDVTLFPSSIVFEPILPISTKQLILDNGRNLYDKPFGQTTAKLSQQDTLEIINDSIDTYWIHVKYLESDGWVFGLWASEYTERPGS